MKTISPAGNFYELNDSIPRITEGDKHSQKFLIGDTGDVRIALPGKYADITDGGDFVVDTKIGDSWVPMKHTDYFDVVDKMMQVNPEWCRNVLGPAIVALTKGRLTFDDIDKVEAGPWVDGMSPRKFLRTMLLIMVAEHRRFAKYEPVGGRNLVIRFLLGIIYECWTAQEAALCVKTGKRGLQKLRATYQSEPHFNEVLKGVA